MGYGVTEKDSLGIAYDKHNKIYIVYLKLQGYI